MHQNSKNSANKFVSIKNGMEFSITLMENYCLPSFFFYFCLFYFVCASHSGALYCLFSSYMMSEWTVRWRWWKMWEMRQALRSTFKWQTKCFVSSKFSSLGRSHSDVMNLHENITQQKWQIAGRGASRTLSAHWNCDTRSSVVPFAAQLALECYLLYCPKLCSTERCSVLCVYRVYPSFQFSAPWKINPFFNLCLFAERKWIETACFFGHSTLCWLVWLFNTGMYRPQSSVLSIMCLGQNAVPIHKFVHHFFRYFSNIKYSCFSLLLHSIFLRYLLESRTMVMFFTFSSNVIMFRWFNIGIGRGRVIILVQWCLRKLLGIMRYF